MERQRNSYTPEPAITSRCLLAPPAPGDAASTSDCQRSLRMSAALGTSTTTVEQCLDHRRDNEHHLDASRARGAGVKAVSPVSRAGDAPCVPHRLHVCRIVHVPSRRRTSHTARVMARQAFFLLPCVRSPPPGARPPITAPASTRTRCRPPSVLVTRLVIEIAVSQERTYRLMMAESREDTGRSRSPPCSSLFGDRICHVLRTPDGGRPPAASDSGPRSTACTSTPRRTGARPVTTAPGRHRLLVHRDPLQRGEPSSSSPTSSARTTPDKALRPP